MCFTRSSLASIYSKFIRYFWFVSFSLRPPDNRCLTYITVVANDELFSEMLDNVAAVNEAFKHNCVPDNNPITHVPPGTRFLIRIHGLTAFKDRLVDRLRHLQSKPASRCSIYSAEHDEVRLIEAGIREAKEQIAVSKRKLEEIKGESMITVEEYLNMERINQVMQSYRSIYAGINHPSE